MPECLNCGAFVTDDYVRVVEPDGAENARCCPECPDLVRGWNGLREKRSAGRQAQRDGAREDCGRVPGDA